MKSLPVLKNAERERRLFRLRVQIAVVFTVLLAAVVVARLLWLQVINHEHFTTLSHENRLKIVPLPPPRGLIYSRDGAVLAENKPSFALVVVRENAQNLDQAVRELVPLLGLSDDDVEQFHKQIELSRRFENVTLKSDLSDEQVAIFSVNQHRFPGFSIAAGLTRHYPFGQHFAHVIGYVGRVSEADLASIDTSNYAATFHIGKTGVEKAREPLLHGRVGYQRVEVNAQGRVLRVVEREPPVPGADLHLTIDAGLQNDAIDALDGRYGAVVAVDVPSGGVLVFVSNPSFDPNAFVNGISRERFREWNTSSARPLFNRALQGNYPPGSTVKPLVALAGLEYGVRRSKDATWCPGWYSLPGDSHRYRDWLKEGHGHVDLRTSIARSCDVYFYALARDLGINRLHDMLARFGFGEITGIDIPGESAGLLPSAAWKKRARRLPWYPGETLITGIGQGFMLVTPLQLAHAISIVAARGDVAIPHFLDHFEGVDKKAGFSEIPPDIYRRGSVKLVRDSWWDEVTEGMVDVVHGATGTARRSGSGAAVRFAGKTGTAQVFGISQDEDAKEKDIPQHLRDHALFVAFAPAADPRIAIAVVVENGGSGSQTAAPIARRLIDAFFTAEPGAYDGKQ